MKYLSLGLLYLGTISGGLARLPPYAETLEKAEAIAIVTVIACEQTFDGTFIHSSAVLSVDTAIAGAKKGTSFREEFGVPQKPVAWKEGVYSQETTFLSDTASYQIAERYLVLLKKKGREWTVIRESWIVDGLVADGYFESFAGSRDVPLSKAIEILSAYRKGEAPNHAPDRMPGTRAQGEGGGH